MYNINPFVVPFFLSPSIVLDSLSVYSSTHSFDGQFKRDLGSGQANDYDAHIYMYIEI